MLPFKAGERPCDWIRRCRATLLGVDEPCGTRIRGPHRSSETLLSQHGPLLDDKGLFFLWCTLSRAGMCCLDLFAHCMPSLQIVKLCSDPFHKYLLNSERGLVQGTRNQAETRQMKTDFMGHHDALGQGKKPSYKKPG